MNRDGQCLCGAVRVALAADPARYPWVPVPDGAVRLPRGRDG